MIATEDLRNRLQSMLEEYLRLRTAHRQLETSERRRRQAERELQAAKEAAEAAESRSAFLAEASVILTSSLDYQETLARLARLPLPRLADYCMLFGVEESGEIRQLAAAHVDPGKQVSLDRLGEVYLPRESGFLARVAATAEPLLVQEVAEPELEALAGNPEILGIFRALSPRSTMVLPMTARGRVVGVLLLAADQRGRAYDEKDLELGLDLARRASIAVENARLYREARSASQAKDHFLAALSHELRTPLAPVLATVSALADDASLPAAVHDRLAMVRRNVELEARLIDDLLDLTRITHGKLELRPEVTDVGEMVRQALRNCCTEDVDNGRLRLELDFGADDHRLWADPPRLMQVFWNLLKNAVKFTPDGGSIRVRSYRQETPEGPRLVVEVADTGIGIEPGVLPRLFQGFEQGSRAITRRFGGLGLGLAISRAIVELHGGRLWAASEGPGRGALFVVDLPVGVLPPAGTPAATVPAIPEAVAADEAAVSLRILLVEDHADTAEALADLLRLMGHEVAVAGSVAAGLAAAEEESAAGGVDLVVSDLGLPDGSGQDLMRELVRRYGWKGIALSGYGMEEDVHRSREAGFAHHLTKPVALEALRSAIRQVAGE
jgi:signal transduction histidine kinase/ActR/RegA family two-component response regulator